MRCENGATGWGEFRDRRVIPPLRAANRATLRSGGQLLIRLKSNPGQLGERQMEGCGRGRFGK